MPAPASRLLENHLGISQVSRLVSPVTCVCLAASHWKEVKVALGSMHREIITCLSICIVKKMGKKHTGGEGNQGLGPEAWKAPVKSQISAWQQQPRCHHGCTQHHREMGKGFFKIRARSINLRS